MATLTSPALIARAEASSGAIEDVIRKAAADWTIAYAAVAQDRKNATAKAIADSLPKGSGCSSPATITDMERAARIADPAAWDALWRLPVPTNGKRVTTLHGLVAKARKAGGAPAVDALVSKAADAVAKAADAEDEATRVARTARAYSGLVNALNTLKPAPVETETEETETEPVAPTEAIAPTEAEAPTLDSRVLRLAGECESVRIALSGGGMVTRDALVALGQHARDLARDIAAMLTEETRAAS